MAAHAMVCSIISSRSHPRMQLPSASNVGRCSGSGLRHMLTSSWMGAGGTGTESLMGRLPNNSWHVKGR